MMSFILSSSKRRSAHARKSDSLGFSILCHGYCILDSLSVELGFRRKISQIPDSLTWGDSDPMINMFSVKLKPVN